MSSEFANRVVLVTGATGSVGRSVAKLMAESGAKVIAVDLDIPSDWRDSPDKAAGNVRKVAADVADERSVEELFTWIGKRHRHLDVLVHCAGVIHEAPLLETALSDFDRVMAVNLRSTFLVGRESIRLMHPRRGGRVILMASDLSHIGRETFSSYVASKHAVLGLARSWAIEFAPGILVNAICPGPIDTATLNAEHVGQDWRDRELDIPLRRMGDTMDIAKMALFLSGSGGSFITGQSININGGSVMI